MDSQTAKPRVRARQERGQRRIDELLRAAEGLFARNGYDQTTMTDIAAEAGAAIGSLYQFFPKKELIAEELRASYFKTFDEKLTEIRNRGRWDDPAALGRALLRLVMDMQGECPAVLAIMEVRALSPYVYRDHLRQGIYDILLRNRPGFEPTHAHRMAMVVRQIMKAAAELKIEPDLTGKEGVLREMEKMISIYFLHEFNHLDAT